MKEREQAGQKEIQNIHAREQKNSWEINGTAETCSGREDAVVEVKISSTKQGLLHTGAKGGVPSEQDPIQLSFQL